MKKLILGICLFMVATIICNAQGLQGLIVEKYYVTNANDATVSSAQGGGTLPAGSITWRFYADLAPGYNFQALYGEDKAPAGISAGDHELRLETSTSFFNNENDGATAPTYSKSKTAQNSVMLDSWFSVGGACTGHFGVLKTADNGVNTTVNANGMLLNNAPSAGIPLTTQDGLLAGTTVPVTFVGLSAAELAIFDNTNTGAKIFSTYNASVAALGGSMGPDADNRVLIAQMTTEGMLTYKFNIQVGTPSGGVENYVSSDPVGGEILMASLAGILNQPNTCPTVSITAPANGATFFVGDSVTINANATDPDGTITSVEFFVNGVSIGVDNTSPYSKKYVATNGTKTLTAVATDNGGCSTTSSAITITVGTNTPPTVSVTAPANGALLVEGTLLNITTNAADPDGTISYVQFLVEGNPIGNDSTAAYSKSWTTVLGGHTITAKAYDNNGASTVSAPVNVTVISSTASYSVVTGTNKCDENIFCLPIQTLGAVDNIKGYDVTIQYNKTKVDPTGAILVSSDIVNPAYVTPATSIDAANGLIYVSLYFNSSAPGNAKFSGTGNVFCVEFVKTSGFNNVDTAQFSVPNLQESYITGVQTKIVNGGSVRSFQKTDFHSTLTFWKDGSPLAYDGTGVTTLVTDIYSNNGLCNSPSTTAQHPDATGKFVTDLTNGTTLDIRRDISPTVSVQPVVNGFDAYLVKRVLINDASFVPSAYQMISMDVNMDGVISAGDLSQINQRAVLAIGEFQQAWNYSAGGVSNGKLSKDWIFVEKSILNTLPYQISKTFPFNDGIGYSKAKVPVVPFCLTIPVLSSASGCSSLGEESYKGILVGDVNGNFATVGSVGERAEGHIIVDLSHATKSNGFFNIPLEVVSGEEVHSLDLSMNMQASNVTYSGLNALMNNIEKLGYFNSNDAQLRITAHSLDKIELQKPILSIALESNKNEILESDFQNVEAFINGNPANFVFKSNKNANPMEIQVEVFPNPASNNCNIVTSEDAKVEFTNMDGMIPMTTLNTKANELTNLSLDNFISGIYLVKVYNQNKTIVKRLVISK